jgi:hypothetical protein
MLRQFCLSMRLISLGLLLLPVGFEQQISTSDPFISSGKLPDLTETFIYLDFWLAEVSRNAYILNPETDTR